MPDPLQGKSTLEKIAIESLLNMCDSIETEDSLLDKNAQLMPVDRPPDIPIEPKDIIPTEPVNSESEPAAERALKIPAPNKGADTDKTEVLEEQGQGAENKTLPESTESTKPSQTKNKKKKQKWKKAKAKKSKPEKNWEQEWWN